MASCRWPFPLKPVYNGGKSFSSARMPLSTTQSAAIVAFLASGKEYFITTRPLRLNCAAASSLELLPRYQRHGATLSLIHISEPTRL